MITVGHPYEVHNEYNHNSKRYATKISHKNNSFPKTVRLEDFFMNKNISLKMNVTPTMIQLFSSSVQDKKRKL